jgi:hypothetical protein
MLKGKIKKKISFTFHIKKKKVKVKYSPILYIGYAQIISIYFFQSVFV